MRYTCTTLYSGEMKRLASSDNLPMPNRDCSRMLFLHRHTYYIIKKKKMSPRIERNLDVSGDVLAPTAGEDCNGVL